VPARVEGQSVSRGEVVRRLACVRDPRELKRGARELPLDHIRPFRLITVFLRSHEIVELRWDHTSFTGHVHPWEPRQWISSGFDEPGAERMRSAEFRRRSDDADFGSLAWLRRLHRSHSPEKGPFSTCMHRTESVTVSYTEVTVTARIGRMRYLDGAPCEG
jgi:hypothetical protein